jgi:hypothetical protein
MSYVLTYALMFVAYMVVLTYLAGKGAGTAEPHPERGFVRSAA